MSTTIIGMGQLGGVFARGLLKLGETVHPVLRGETPSAESERILVAVGEADLESVAEALQIAGRTQNAIFLQNDLVRTTLKGFESPTVAVVWFEKKHRKPITPILSTPIAGPHAEMLVRALDTLQIPAHEISMEQLDAELAAKNAYILTFNVLGLARPAGATVGQLIKDPIFAPLVDEVLSLEEARIAGSLDREATLTLLRNAVAGDPAHGAKGRSAPARLKNALARGAKLAVPLPQMEEIAAAQS